MQPSQQQGPPQPGPDQYGQRQPYPQQYPAQPYHQQPMHPAYPYQQYQQPQLPSHFQQMPGMYTSSPIILTINVKKKSNKTFKNLRQCALCFENHKLKKI